MERSEKAHWVGVAELVTPMGAMRFVGKPAQSERLALWNAGVASAHADAPMRKAEEQAKRLRLAFPGAWPMSVRVSAERIVTVTQVFTRSVAHSERSV